MILDSVLSAMVSSHFATFQKYWCLLQLGEEMNNSDVLADGGSAIKQNDLVLIAYDKTTWYICDL